jgi:hypothetical protein
MINNFWKKNNYNNKINVNIQNSKFKKKFFWTDFIFLFIQDKIIFIKIKRFAFNIYLLGNFLK